MNSASLKRTLCAVMACSVAFPYTVFASTLNPQVAHEQDRSAQAPSLDEMISRFPEVIHLIELAPAAPDVTATDAAGFEPLGGAIENRKTKETLEFVCLEHAASTGDCARFQMRSNHAQLVGPEFRMKSVSRDELRKYIEARNRQVHDHRKLAYVGHIESSGERLIDSVASDFMEGINQFAEALENAQAVLPVFLSGSAVFYGFLVLGYAVGGAVLILAWVLGPFISVGLSGPALGVAIVAFHLAADVVGNIILDPFIALERTIVTIQAKVRERRLGKAMRILMSQTAFGARYKVSNRNFTFLKTQLIGLPPIASERQL